MEKRFHACNFKLGTSSDKLFAYQIKKKKVGLGWFNGTDPKIYGILQRHRLRRQSEYIRQEVHAVYLYVSKLLHVFFNTEWNSHHLINRLIPRCSTQV